jgi:DNA-binding MarR family transcriptional regulator
MNLEQEMAQIKPLIDEDWELPLSQMITFRLSRVHSKVIAQATRILTKHSKLSLMQWRVLVSVKGIENATHSKIAAKTDLDGGQLSRCVRSMTETGLLESKTHESDSRQHYLLMTEKGMSVYQEARPHMRRRQAEFIEALTSDEYGMFFNILEKLEKIAESEEFFE